MKLSKELLLLAYTLSLTGIICEDPTWQDDQQTNHSPFELIGLRAYITDYNTKLVSAQESLGTLYHVDFKTDNAWEKWELIP